MARPLTAPDALPVATGAGIVGLGVHLPDDRVTNADLETLLDTSDDWITSRTGIRERRRVARTESTSDLAVVAAEAALRDAAVPPDSLDAVIVATTTPDHTIPQTAPAVAAALGSRAAAFDVGAGCTGFVYGLAVGSSLIAAGVAQRLLLVGAETLTRFVDDGDRETAVLFGDGAGAVVLDGAARGAVGPFDLGSDGDLAGSLMVPAGGARRPADETTVATGEHHLRMNGREVYRQAVGRMVDSSRAVLERAEAGVRDIDLLVGHQANARILEAVASRLGIDDDRALIAIERFGNTSAASIPLALDDAQDRGLLADGTTVLLTAFGAGLTWGSCLVTWDRRG